MLGLKKIDRLVLFGLGGNYYFLMNNEHWFLL